MNLQYLLEGIVKEDASDLHLTANALPTFRIDGNLLPAQGTHPLAEKEVQDLCFALTTEEQKNLLLANKEIDFSFSLGDLARFRVNIYHQRGSLAAAIRYIPVKIRTIEELNLPHIVRNFTRLPQGFILVCGPTGHGKSTTLAALVNEINENRADHIITIEDPIEYIFPNRRCLVSQRELHNDTHSWEIALRSALREDPDVVLIGEMRDYETIAAALTIAETGHLVFSTLHTNSASQAIDRIIDIFPEHQQNQVRAQLANVLEGVLSQRLIPAIKGGRYPAVEILLINPAVRSLVREDKVHQLDNLIATSGELGMLSLEQSLAMLVNSGRISLEQAQAHTLHPEELLRIIKSRPKTVAA